MSHAAVEPGRVQGRVAGGKDGTLVLTLPDTDYRLHLLCGEAVAEGPVHGIIRAVARRVDAVRGGGRFIEPVNGRPRRVQGRVAGTDAQANTLIVQCAPGCTIVCRLTSPGQRASEFTEGQLVSFDVERGATFEPMK